MKSLFAFIILSISTQAATTNYRSELVNKLIAQVTSFFQPAQLHGFCIVGMSEMIKKSEPSEITGAIYDFAFDNLTSTQYYKAAQTLMAAQQEFGSMENVNKTIQKCVAGVSPIAKQYYPLIIEQIDKQKTEDKKLNAGYKFSSSQCNNTLWQKLAAGCKSKLSKSAWSKAINLIKDYLKLESMGIK
ncbi:hypothetical protein M3Y97_01068900 [Aphelenchoides bicaudatus]|nr:hypothetical protein M3Y97_01068900 [Aphelenchoides bicaudatus]